MFNICASLGLRMSMPTRTTFLPSSENDEARLTLTNDLPSPDIELVTSITLSSLVGSMNWILLRSKRNSSTIDEDLPALTTSSER